MIVYVARVIPAFVMYCVNGASRSSLLIESTDCMMRSSQMCKFQISYKKSPDLSCARFANGEVLKPRPKSLPIV